MKVIPKKLVLSGTMLAFSIAGAVDSSSCGNYQNNKCQYNANTAVAFAKAYATKSTAPPFMDYTHFANGGNCANFVSQAILAGLVGNSNVNTIYQKRRNYLIDKGYNSLSWYFESDGSRGTAWTGADFMY